MYTLQNHIIYLFIIFVYLFNKHLCNFYYHVKALFKTLNSLNHYNNLMRKVLSHLNLTDEKLTYRELK